VPRYVVLEHDHPVLHWDFMIETGDVLRTWRLALPPKPGPTIAALSLGEHRRAYLDYEGPVTGNRGTVVRWDAGTYAERCTEAGLVVVVVQGKRLQGRAVLRQVQGLEWSFEFTDG
jgi:hypothetical protein